MNICVCVLFNLHCSYALLPDAVTTSKAFTLLYFFLYFSLHLMQVQTLSMDCIRESNPHNILKEVYRL